MDDVVSSRVDFGLTGITREAPNCHMEEFFTSQPLLIAREDNEFGLPERPTAEDLIRLPFISFLAENMEEGGDPYFDTSLASLAQPMHTVLSVNNYHLMLRYVKQGMGVAIMDELCLMASKYGNLGEGLRSYSLEGILPPVHNGILLRDHKHLSPQAAALIARMRDELKDGLSKIRELAH